MQKRRWSGSERLFFYHQLLTLVTSGMNLSRASRLAGEDSTCGVLSAIFNELSWELGQGSSLSEFMAKRPDLFSPYERDIIRAGEKTEEITRALKWLSDFSARENDQTRMGRVHLLYLMFTLLLGVGCMALVSLIIIPAFEEFYGALGDALPAPTLMVIRICSWKLLFPIFFLCVGLISFVYKRYPEVSSLALTLVPILGGKWIYREAVTFCALLGQSLDAGVAPLRALSGAANFVNHPYLKKSLKSAGSYIKNGETWAMALGRISHFPPVVTGFVKMGEEQGEMGKAFLEISQSEIFLQNEQKQIMEFVPLAVLAGIILFIAFAVIAMYLPIFYIAGMT